MDRTTAGFFALTRDVTCKRKVRAPESLRRNFAWVFGGNTVYAICNWGILVVLAKFGSSEAVGQFALGLAITSPIFIFSGLNLRAVQATDAQNLYSLEDYFQLRYLTIALAMTATVVVSIAAGYDMSLVAIILAVAVLKSIDGISDISHGLYQKHETMFYIAKAMTIKGPISLFVFFITYFMFSSIAISTLLSATLRLLIFYIYERPLGCAILRNSQICKTTPRREHLVLMRLTLLALPLGFVAMINSLVINIPRYFVEKINGMEQLGIFAGIAYLMVTGNMVVTAMGQSTNPRLARYFAEGQYHAFVKLLTSMVMIAIAIGAAGIVVALLFGSTLLKILYNSEYAAYEYVFVLIMTASLFNYVSSFLGFGMTAARKFVIQTPISIFSLLAICLLSMILIPPYGIVGACYCLMILNFMQIPIKLYVLTRSMRN